MNKILKTFVLILIIVSVSAAAPAALAQITVPHPFVDFSGIFVAFLPVCLNGALVVVVTPVPLVLLFPYIPITPIVPVFKLWGPIPSAATEGNFVLGGICFVPVPGLFGAVVIPVPVLGTLIQIATTLGPSLFAPVIL